MSFGLTRNVCSRSYVANCALQALTLGSQPWACVMAACLLNRSEIFGRGPETKSEGGEDNCRVYVLPYPDSKAQDGQKALYNTVLGPQNLKARGLGASGLQPKARILPPQRPCRSLEPKPWRSLELQSIQGVPEYMTRDPLQTQGPTNHDFWNSACLGPYNHETTDMAFEPYVSDKKVSGPSGIVVHFLGLQVCKWFLRWRLKVFKQDLRWAIWSGGDRLNICVACL